MKLFKKTFIAFIPSIFLYIWWIKIVTSDPVHIFGFLSFFYFFLSLLISPLAYIIWKIKFLRKSVNHIIIIRRQLWILTAIFAILHVLKFYENIIRIYEKFYSSSMNLFNFIITSLSWAEWNIFGMNIFSFWFGLIWIVLMHLLLITSNNYSQKLFGSKMWKRIQLLAYPLFILIVLHIYFIWWWKWAYLYPTIILFILRFYCWFDKNFKYKWKNKISQNGYRKFLCPPCWFIYDEEFWDPDGWLAPWTKYKEIPDDWICPVCWAEKKDFIPLDWHYNPYESENHELIFNVVSKKFLTRNVIELKLYSEREIELLPGQFCNLIFDSKEGKKMRSYSVSEYKDNTLTFIIKLKDWWVWWEHFKILLPNKKIYWAWPFWNFVLQKTSKKKIFIATWTGLSPIYNMMRTSWDTKKVLYLWFRNKEDIFYQKKLKAIPNLEVKIYLSKEKNNSYNYWRISYNKINYSIDDEVYICWNPWLVEELNKKFQLSEKENVYFEKFL